MHFFKDALKRSGREFTKTQPALNHPIQRVHILDMIFRCVGQPLKGKLMLYDAENVFDENESPIGHFDRWAEILHFLICKIDTDDPKMDFLANCSRWVSDPTIIGLK